MNTATTAKTRRRLAMALGLMICLMVSTLATTGTLPAAQSAQPNQSGRPAVTGLTVAPGTNAGELNVSWTAHAGNNKDYRVAWAPQGENFRGWADTDWNAYPTGASHTITGLNNNTTYKVRVKARFNRGPSSPWSPIKTATTTEPPAEAEQEAAEPPAQVRSVDSSQEAGDGTGTSPVTVSWNAVDGATNYQVQRNTGPSGAGESTTTGLGADATSHQDTDTEYHTRYWYRVRAGNEAGRGPWSDDAEIRTARQAGTPAAPGDITATEDQPGTVVITWTVPDGDEAVDGYRVYRRDIASGTEMELATHGANGTSHSDDTVMPERWYSWWVVAHNGVGDSPNSRMQSLSTKVQTTGAPNAPTGLTLSEDTAGQVVVSWNAAPNGPEPAEYRIYRRKLPQVDTHILTSVSAGTTSHTDRTVEGEAWYEYHVRAMNLAGDSSAEGPEAILTKPQTPGVPDRPTSVTATEDTAGEVTVSWTAPSSGASPTGYKVYRKRVGSNGAHTLIGTVDSPGTSYTDDTVDGEVWYDYRVRATNSAGDSGESGPETILTQAQTAGAPPAPEDTDAAQ